MSPASPSMFNFTTWYGLAFLFGFHIPVSQQYKVQIIIVLIIKDQHFCLDLIKRFLVFPINIKEMLYKDAVQLLSHNPRLGVKFKPQIQFTLQIITLFILLLSKWLIFQAIGTIKSREKLFKERLPFFPHKVSSYSPVV